MFNIRGLDHINIQSSKYQESIKFYSELFGMEVKEEGVGMDGVPFTIVGKTGALYLALYDNVEAHDLGKTIAHLGVNVDNFDEAYSAAVEYGAKIADYGIVEYPKSKSFYLFDPNGIGIEVSSVFGGGLD